MANKVFRVKDMCDQEHLCYLIGSLSHLRIVKMTVPANRGKVPVTKGKNMLFSAMTCIEARDAAPLKVICRALLENEICKL